MPEKKILTSDVSQYYGLLLANVIHQILMASKVWAITTICAWLSFFACFWLLLATQDWIWLIGLALMGLFANWFSKKIAPIQMTGGTDARTIGIPTKPTGGSTP